MGIVQQLCVIQKLVWKNIRRSNGWYWKRYVDLQLNFDDTLKEPTVLPTRVPNLLINGASGIAVGMATNMPPHNLSEVVDGTIKFIDNTNISIEELIESIKAPDFPTGELFMVMKV